MEKEFESWLEHLRFHGVDGRFLAEKLRECYLADIEAARNESKS
jgi:hypothetical protein